MQCEMMLVMEEKMGRPVVEWSCPSSRERRAAKRGSASAKSAAISWVARERNYFTATTSNTPTQR